MKRNTVLFLVLGILLWFLGINDPYVGGYGAANTLLSLAAKNFLRFGFENLNFLPTYFVGPSLPYVVPYYLHHPFLQFYLLAFSFKIFGFSHWVGYLPSFVFSLGSVILVYRLGSVISSKKTGLLAAAFFTLMPIITVYGVKQAGFEQGVLFSSLGVIYYFVKYFKEEKKKYLVYIGIYSFLGIAIDWGILYLLPAFILSLFLFSEKKKQFNALLVYLVLVFLGTLGFFLIVYRVFGNFEDFISQIQTRAFDQELFGLENPLVSLVVITALRFIIYFSPFITILTIFYLKRFFTLLKNNTLSSKTFTLFTLFIFGLVNFIIVPASTWQHIYFIMYLAPFFALTGALFLSERNTHKIVVYMLLFITFVWSGAVSYFKYQQIHKQVWRYQAGREITKLIPQYEELGVYGFPGDILSYYFDYPTMPLSSYDEITKYLIDKNQPVVFSCWGSCSADDLDFISQVSISFEVIDLLLDNRIWVITTNPSSGGLSVKEAKQERQIEKPSFIENGYRLLRNSLKVGQL